MSFLLLSPDQVEALHDMVLNPGELPGRALDKSLEGALSRVDNRLIYGLIEDVFDLAAAYATAVATGHCFNDGNKRTAYRTMVVCLKLNGVTITHETHDIGNRIILLAQGHLPEADFADWLRSRA
ncbi:MAG: type II toxin-antitoxin system death-on-curing family toxin [Rhodobacteraceae bacterium]|nr:MAG: type II toxin-antitoxin system death-on-curing family toxin [Paracoccaceae bacterium]